MIISTAYFPPISHILALRDGAIVEAKENFQKHSVRNRAEIMTATGVQCLSVPIVGGRGVRAPISEVRIDHSEPFQREHLRSVFTAYRSAPYFEHFIDRIEPLFTLNEKFLLDYNTRILQEILSILRIDIEVRYTEEFIGVNKCSEPVVEPYFQVFSDRQPFIGNLSILDSIFCRARDI